MQGEAGIFSALKRTLLAMALLVTSVFGGTGCGSDDDVQVESRAKNAAPKVPEKGTPASGGPSKGDCKRLDRIDRDFRDLYDRLDECGLR